MGQEIHDSRFRKQDFEHFGKRLKQETDLLKQWFETGRFSHSSHIAGFELETWLLDRELEPLADNERLLERLKDPMVTPELARFNIELNTDPVALSDAAFSRSERQIAGTWAHCQEVAEGLDARLLMTGIPANLRESSLRLENMSAMLRYRALNEQVLRSRKGRPLVLDIQGEEHLHLEHHDVMLESAATSFQLHLQVTPENAVRYYNASVIASAPVVAVAANSPYLFGKDLWAETRIPLFEQAVDVGGFDGAAFGPIRRVSFGSGYVRQSLFELFEENEQHFPILLAEHMEEAPERMDHLRLHNGTIWRWNRPLIGFDGDGSPHLRIEHRVIPAGPSLADGMANAAFYYGLAESLASAEQAPEAELDFITARDNFYAAARYGLRAPIRWPGLGEPRRGLRELVLETLLPLAESGLARQGLDEAERAHYLGIIERRVESGRNGAQWQRDFVARHGRDWGLLMRAYYENQAGQRPVHEWET
ncbi:MAG: glutamate--cysteine ligase [Gammaproteobacteria bacterium]|nr:glutamate--cysteine ligase [Gammaproteobacteria bacterium]